MRCQPNHSPKPPFSIHAPTATCTGPDSLPMRCPPNPLAEAPIFYPCSDRHLHRPGFPPPCTAIRTHSPKPSPPFSIYAPTAACTGPESLPVPCLPNPLAEAPIFNPCSDRRPHRPGIPSRALPSESTRRSPLPPPFFNPCSDRPLHRPGIPSYAPLSKPTRRSPHFSIHAPIAACTGPGDRNSRSKCVHIDHKGRIQTHSGHPTEPAGQPLFIKLHIYFIALVPTRCNRPRTRCTDASPSASAPDSPDRPLSATYLPPGDCCTSRIPRHPATGA